MRISDWSSDVCSSDLPVRAVRGPRHPSGHHGGRRPLGLDDPGRGAIERRDAAAGAQRAARGGVRAGRAAVADHLPGRPPHRDRGHPHRSDAPDLPCDRRNRAPAVARGGRHLHPLHPPRRAHGTPPRVRGDTAPRLLTAGVATSMNYNLCDWRMATLPVFAYSQYMNQCIPAQAFIDRAWSAALVLIVIVMLLNLVARLVAKIFSPKLAR